MTRWDERCPHSVCVLTICSHTGTTLSLGIITYLVDTDSCTQRQRRVPRGAREELSPPLVTHGRCPICQMLPTQRLETGTTGTPRESAAGSFLSLPSVSWQEVV